MVICTDIMGRMLHSQLLVILALSFLALRSNCHPRPTVDSLVTSFDLERDVRHIDIRTMPEVTDVERAAGTRLRHRSIGFQHIMDLGSGWNMYYSSWASFALPVSK